VAVALIDSSIVPAPPVSTNMVHADAASASRTARLHSGSLFMADHVLRAQSLEPPNLRLDFL